jgi:hypothetical protein
MDKSNANSFLFSNDSARIGINVLRKLLEIGLITDRPITGEESSKSGNQEQAGSSGK